MSRVLDLWAGMTGTVLDFAGTAAPSGWLLCYGQSVLRTDYPNLFSAIGTTHGSVDGTHFTLPDCRGVVVAGVGNMGGSPSGRLGISTTGTTTAASAVVTAIPSTAALSPGMLAIGGALPSGVTITSVDSGTQVTLSTGVGVTAATAGAIRFCIMDAHTVGAFGGSHTHTLSTYQMPNHLHNEVASGGASGGSSGAPVQSNTFSNTNAAGTTQATGGGGAHPNLQPTMVLNKIIKT